jgi:hypothetical protein
VIPVAVDELGGFAGAVPMPFDALVVLIREGEFRFTCTHCAAELVAADIGTDALEPLELNRRLEQHLALRHSIDAPDIRFWDGREAAAAALARAQEVTGE